LFTLFTVTVVFHRFLWHVSHELSMSIRVLLIRLKHVATKLKKRVSDLSYIGPRRVMRGDLADASLEGVVFAPTGRTPVPTVIIIPDWLTPARSYYEIARHLASWGMACIVPKLANTALNDAGDLSEQLTDLIKSLPTMQLGNGAAQLSDDAIALLGHGLGGAVVAETASQKLSLKGVVAAYPTDSSPSPLDYTPHATAPALIICPGYSAGLSTDISKDFANSWGAPVVMRKVPGCTRMGMAGNNILERFGLSETNDKKPLRAQLSLITGYLWYQLSGDDDYEDFASLESEIAGTEVVLTRRQHAEAEIASKESKHLFAGLHR